MKPMKLLTVAIITAVILMVLAGGFIGFLNMIDDSCGTNLSVHDISSTYDFSNQSQIPDYIEVINITTNNSPSMLVIKDLITSMKVDNKTNAYVQISNSVYDDFNSIVTPIQQLNHQAVFYYDNMYVQAGFMVC